MDDPVLWYFSYGSNMSRAVFVERRGMRPAAARPAWLADHALRFDLPIGPGERGVANVVPEVGAGLWGVLWGITARELDRLDRSEGVHMGVYERVPVDVVVDGGERVGAVTYRSSRGTPGRRPSARYLRLLLTGAREHGLPTAYVATLERVQLAWDEREPGGGGPL
jgi:cation transport regulator ChaC